MAIFQDPAPAGITLYTPGTTKFQASDNTCVEAGDRVFFAKWNYVTNGSGEAPNTVTADENNLFPHWCYRPSYSRKQDPDDLSTMVSNPLESVGGNAAATSAIRLDFQSFYCPWAGTISVEGGTGPGSPGGDMQITFLWCRSRRQRFQWWETVAALIHRGVHREGGGALRMPRVPTNARGMGEYTLSFYNVLAGTPIARPVCATKVLTPDSQTLVFSTSPTSLAINVVTSKSNPVSLGPWTIVTPTADASVLEFVVEF